MKMKKIMLFFGLIILSHNFINAMPGTFYKNVTSKQTTVNGKIKTGWINTDTTKVFINLNDNILLFENKEMKNFNIIEYDSIKYDNSTLYRLIGVDDNDEGYNIDFCHYKDNNMFLTIYNEKAITRYKFNK